MERCELAAFKEQQESSVTSEGTRGKCLEKVIAIGQGWGGAWERGSAGP